MYAADDLKPGDIKGHTISTKKIAKENHKTQNIEQLSLLEKHALQEIADCQKEENLKKETYHSSLLEKTEINLEPTASVNKFPNLHKDLNTSQSSDDNIIERKNIIEDAALPRIQNEHKPLVSNTNFLSSKSAVGQETIAPTVNEPAIERRTLSLGDLHKIVDAQKHHDEESKATVTETVRVTTQSDETEQVTSKKIVMKSSRYAVIRTIGKGNFAKVKLAKHLATDKIVAIKMIDKTKIEKKELSKISREVALMKELHHPNIVQLLEVMESETTLCLVMEYASGGELFDNLVAHGKMNEREARLKFREMLSAVQYCHSKSIVHRDLKAENMLLNDKLEIKIADFGFANKFNLDSVLSTSCGSPPYAAPELFQGRDYVGPEVDIWALGVILFSLVSGRLPFDGESMSDLRRKVINLRYEFPYYVSNDCENLLKKILVQAKDRASLDMIINDPWVNGNGLPKITAHKDEDFVVCPKRYEMLKEMGFLESDIEETFRLKKFNMIHATYELLKPKSIKPLSAYQRSRGNSVNDPTRRVQTKPIDAPVPTPREPTPPRTEAHSLTGEQSVTFAKALKNLFAKKVDTPDFNNRARESVHDTLSAGFSKDVQKQYQNAMSHITHEMMADPNSSIPKGTNQQALFATINQLSITKHHKAGMFQPTTIGALTHKQIMENNQFSAPPIFLKNAKTPIRGNNEPSVNLGKFTVQNIKLTKSKSDAETDESIATQTIKKKKPSKAKKPEDTSSALDSKTKKKPAPSKDTISEITPRIADTAWSKFDPKIKPAIANFAFSMNTVSSKHADEILIEIIRVLEHNSFSYDFLEKYLLLCNINAKQIEIYGDPIQWEMEVCRIPILFMNGVRIKRIFGSTFSYKKEVTLCDYWDKVWHATQQNFQIYGSSFVPCQDSVQLRFYITFFYLIVPKQQNTTSQSIRSMTRPPPTISPILKRDIRRELSKD